MLPVIMYLYLRKDEEMGISLISIKDKVSSTEVLSVLLKFWIKILEQNFFKFQSSVIIRLMNISGNNQTWLFQDFRKFLTDIFFLSETFFYSIAAIETSPIATVAMGKYFFSSSESKPFSQNVVHTIISKQNISWWCLPGIIVKYMLLIHILVF